VFLERRPYEGWQGAFTFEPRDANAVRIALLHMVLNDPKRKRVAFSLLGQIEHWRLEHGRPDFEPRHPELDARSEWPPISAAS
jgi:hypothetical protein